MIVLSIDVGIKNLAVCCLEVDLDNKKYEIIDWNVHDLCKNEVKHCRCKNKRGEICGKHAKYIKGDIYCCKTHANTSEFCLPTAEMNMKSLKKKRISELYSIAKNYNIKHEEKVTKPKLLELFEAHIKEKYFEVITTVKIDDMHMVTIGRNIANIFNEKYKHLNIDHVIIENQISPIANKMKTVQGMLAQYFIMTSLCEIVFVSSINKLKNFEGCQQLTYKDRKKKSIEITQEQLVNKQNQTYLDIFHKSNKKDDLADSYLQGIWFINEKILG